jgi:hypothetical protein
MPNTAMLTQVNVMFTPPQLDQLDPAAFGPGTATSDAIGALGLSGVAYVGDYVAAMPPAIIQTMMAAIYASLTSDPRSVVMLGWSEGTAYGVTVSQLPSPPAQPRAVTTIVLSGPLTP